MLLPRDERLRPEQLGPFLDELDGEVQSRLLRTWGIGLAILIGGGGLSLGATIATEGAAAVVLVFALIIGVIVLVGGINQSSRRSAKVHFLRHLIESLADELHPKAKVHVRFDLRHYDAEGNKIWSGKSPHGNAKHKYSDKWLHLDVRLADGSEVRIVRQAGIKTKSGNIQKEKRRVFLSFEPNPWLYRLPPGATHAELAKRLREKIPLALHDLPEDFQVKLDGGDGKFRLKFMQEDAPILPDEVVYAVREMLAYLAPLKV